MKEILSVSNILNSSIVWSLLLCVLLWKGSAWKTNIENRLNSLETKTDRVYEIILQKFGNPIEQARSPITLTDYGKDISKSVDATKIANEYTDRLRSEIEGLNPYQVQEYCFEFCKNKLLDYLKDTNNDQYEKIHAFAYKQGIEVEKILRVIGIELRDCIFSISDTLHEDIDKHSPS